MGFRGRRMFKIHFVQNSRWRKAAILKMFKFNILPDFDEMWYLHATWVPGDHFVTKTEPEIICQRPPF